MTTHKTRFKHFLSPSVYKMTNLKLMPSVDEMLEALYKAYDYIELAKLPNGWVCRDHTDEGLCGNRLEIYAPTPTLAVYRAYRTICKKI